MEPYRVYIDESGDHSYRAAKHPSKRFLGLMGFVVESRYYIDTVHARLEALKRTHFRFEPDHPVILTRKRIIENIPGLQIADLLAAAQKEKVIADNQLPLVRPSSTFTQRLNEAVSPFVNQYGQYLLE